MRSNYRLYLGPFRLPLICGILLLCSAGRLIAQEPGVASPAAPNKQASVVPIPSVAPMEYVIAPDDVLDVYILDVPELSRSYRVTQFGQLKFPLLPNPLAAAGLTLDGFAALLTQELKSSGTISDPHVSVTVKESRLHSISVTGSVKSPQTYPLFAPSKLLAVLSQAGGVSDEAGSVVKITRNGLITKSLSTPGEGGPDAIPSDPQTITININDLFNAPDSGANIDIYPGDWINVPRAGVIYVVGAVNRPGGYVLNTSREHLTVLQLVAIAEDLKPTANRQHSMIIRRPVAAGQERQEIALNLKKILMGKEKDVVLEANDILFVPDSSSKKALRRGAEAAIQIATGLALFRL